MANYAKFTIVSRIRGIWIRRREVISLKAVDGGSASSVVGRRQEVKLCQTT
jgi:hypothetical protein